jgi:hypothetical protein
VVKVGLLDQTGKFPNAQEVVSDEEASAPGTQLDEKEPEIQAEEQATLEKDEIV